MEAHLAHVKLSLCYSLRVTFGVNKVVSLKQ